MFFFLVNQKHAVELARFTNKLLLILLINKSWFFLLIMNWFISLSQIHFSKYIFNSQTDDSYEPVLSINI